MKVYQVVLEGPKIEPPLSNTPLTTPSDITSVEIQQSPIKGADGKPLFKVVDQNGKVLFTGSEADANTKLDSLRKNISVNAPASTGAKPDALSNVDLRADAPPNTPTSDSLTRSEQRRLDRTGSITRKGVTYTRANIAAMDAEVARSARIDPKLPGETRPTTTAADTPTPEEAKSMFSKLKKWAKGGISGKIVTTLFNVGKGLLGGTVVNLVLKSIDIVTVVAAHNAYFTELEKFVDADTPEKRTEIVNNLGDIRQNQIIEPTTELFFGALGMALFGSAGAAIAAGIVGVAAAGVSGGTSLILTLIAGGVAMYGAYEGSIYAAKNVPMPGGEGDETIYEFFRTKFDEVWLTPGHLRDLAAEGVDINFGTYVYGLTLNPMQTHTSPLSIPGPTGAYGLVKKLIPGESIAETADDQEEDDTASVADNIAPKLKKAVLADPKLKQLYILGKAEIKKAVRDQEKTNAS
jgi:hypothetical protein